uniref:Feruloyl esterase n=1 Tax=uncultured microorganism TaxID=358574 RepID=A0A5J6D2P0_9ZZZZ|nr:feruloyl esterase [uncultured microorganism]
MAFITVNFMSEALMRTVTVHVVLPADKIAEPGMPEPKHTDFPALYLLHGVFGNQTDWALRTRVQRMAENSDLALIMPAGENAFYLDQEATHANYGDFVGRELPEIMRRMFPLSPRREDCFIAGLSMGGYGALRNGLKYHETFSRIGAFSAALVLDGIENRTNDSPLFIERRDYAEAIFGPLDKVAESDINPLWIARRLVESGTELPGLYLACGTEDFLFEPNVRFRDEVRKLGCELTWDEGPYGHEWDFWNLQVEKFIDWLPLSESGTGIDSGNVGI